jgi:hypothetical protein
MTPTHLKQDAGPITQGKGLDTLDRFIIQNWPPSARFGLWTKQTGALAPRKGSLEHFFNDALKDGWLHGGSGAVITIDPPGEPFVAIRVENRNWTPEATYNPKHWVWKVVPVASVRANLEETLALSLPEAEAAYLGGLRDTL